MRANNLFKPSPHPDGLYLTVGEAGRLNSGVRPYRSKRMDYFWLTLLVVGLVMLVVGYRKNNRNILLGAALVMLASVAVPEMFSGFQEGYMEARERTPAG